MKSTKSGEARRIPIEPALLPLLERLNAERPKRDPGTSRVFWLPKDDVRATQLRDHLMAAGVTRAELHVTDARRKNLTFHDLRATGLTWMAVRGDQPLSIKQRAGHRSFSTTEIYIREAESLTHGFGETFPELPDELTGEFRLRLGSFRYKTLGNVGDLVEQRGIEHYFCGPRSYTWRVTKYRKFGCRSDRTCLDRRDISDQNNTG